jgi:hypothetical protein
VGKQCNSLHQHQQETKQLFAKLPKVQPTLDYLFTIAIDIDLISGVFFASHTKLKF